MADGDFVDYLVAHGAYAEAARVATERGELARAIALYERVWRFADAWPLALKLGDRPLAVRLALDANQPARAAEIAEATPPEGLLAVAEAFAARGRTFEAARAAERAGAWARAAAWYRRAGAPLDEARAETRAGALREAGLIYERLDRRRGAAHEAGAARLALGRLLARLGRAEEAVRHLQVAARLPALRTAAWRALCGPLLALGLAAAPPRSSPRGCTRADAVAAARPRQSWPCWRRRRPRPAATAARAATSGAATTCAGCSARARSGASTRRSTRCSGAPVALKLLAVGGGAAAIRSARPTSRFAREAEAAGRLRHPNIVALADAQPASGLFVFELMTGGTLADRLAARGPAAARRRAPAGARSAGGARRRARARHRPPRREAGERLLRRRRQREAGRLRQRAPGRLRADPDRRLLRNGRVHVARADHRRADRLRRRSLRARRHAVRGAHRPAAVPGARSRRAAPGRGAPSPVVAAARALARCTTTVLARALAKAPADRFGSALEMAEAVAGRGRRRRGGDGDAAARPARAAPRRRRETPAGRRAERELGRTADGRLVLRHDPAHGARRAGRGARRLPLDGAALDELRAIAAAGGPHVQRVLRAVATIAARSGTRSSPAIRNRSTRSRRQERAALAGALAAAARRAHARFVRTPAGPVLLVAPSARLTARQLRCRPRVSW